MKIKTILLTFPAMLLLTSCQLNYAKLPNLLVKDKQDSVAVQQSFVEKEEVKEAVVNKTEIDTLEENNFAPIQLDSLRYLVKYQAQQIDSLLSVIDNMTIVIDSLDYELQLSNQRLMANPSFQIPDSIEFAGQMFNLKNDRVYAKFSEIFRTELKYAYKYIPRSTIYFPIFDTVFSKTDIPLDIKYLAVAESYLNYMAYSSVGAAGIWQFMPATAKIHRLTLNSYIDERRHLIKSTYAAVDYLNKSNSYLKSQGIEDWLLVMASYNAGSGSIIKAARDQGGKNFFDLIMRVDETNSYIWRALAIKMIFENEEKIFGQKFPREPFFFDTVRSEKLVLNGFYKIDDWANAQGTVISKIWEHNPWIKIYKHKVGRYSLINNVILPPGEYEIYVPATAVKDTMRLAEVERKFQQKKQESKNIIVRHTVKKGESIFSIAEKYNMTVAELKSLNGLKRTKVRKGQRLKVYNMIYTNSTSTPDSTTTPAAQDTVVVKKETPKSKYYVVLKGDSIYKIAKKLNVTQDHIISQNNLKVSMKNHQKNVILSPGQKLVY